MAISNVVGKPEPRPNGIIATRKIIAPIAPILNSHLCNSIDTAIKAWHIAIKPTDNEICLENQPLIICLYNALHVRSAYSRYTLGVCREVSQLVHAAHANKMKNRILATRGHQMETNKIIVPRTIEIRSKYP